MEMISFLVFVEVIVSFFSSNIRTSELWLELNWTSQFGTDF